MKNLLLAIVLVVLPTASQAAVTINFTGATFAYEFRLFRLSDIPTDIFGGLLLPDFTKADGLFFAAVSRKTSGAVTTQYLSAGAVTSIDQVATSVPESGTWALMLVRFGLVG